MPPKRETISQRIGGRTRRKAPTAVACALVVATCTGLGTARADDSPAGPPETFADPADPAGALSAVKALLAPLSPPARTCQWPPCSGPSAAVPAYAVTNTVDVPVGNGPSALAVNPKTNKIYVANIRSNNVTVIDGKTNKTTTVPAGPMPNAVAINPVTNKIYVSNQNLDAPNANDPGTVTVIDGKTNKTTTVTVEVQPGFVAVNEKTNKIYVVNNGTNSLSVIDGKTNKVDATAHFRPDGRAPLESGVMSPYDVKVNEVTNQIYVTGPQSNTVAVVDGKTNKFTIVPTGSTPTGAAVNPITNTIYVTDFTTNELTVIDGKTNKTSSVHIEDVQDPLVVAVNPITNKVYVADMTSKAISVVDGVTKKVITIGDLPGKPHDIAINPITNKIYFPLFSLYRGNNVGDDREITGVIEELDGATNTVTTIMAGTTPLAIAVNPNTNKTYVVNQDSNTVTVLSE
jgi:YVTN family beta-propeller protein